MIGYDFDGVLCDAPFIPGNKYRTLTKEEREARHDELVAFFLSASPLLNLSNTTHPFVVITGRVDNLDFRTASEAWLEKYYPSRWKLIMHVGEDRSPPAMAKFKMDAIVQEKVTEYTDDNPNICEYLRNNLKDVNIICLPREE